MPYRLGRTGTSSTPAPYSRAQRLTGASRVLFRLVRKASSGTRHMSWGSLGLGTVANVPPSTPSLALTSVTPRTTSDCHDRLGSLASSANVTSTSALLPKADMGADIDLRREGP